MISCEWHTSGSRLSRHRRSDAALVRDRRLFAGSTRQQRARVPRRHAALRDVRVAGGGLRLRPGRISLVARFFWTWRMPFGGTHEAGWSLKHFLTGLH